MERDDFDKEKIGGNLDKLIVLSDLFHEIADSSYEKREDLDIAKLKISLVKKEMLLLTYLINKEIENLIP